MSGRTVHITKNQHAYRVEARFGFDPDLNPELKQRASARWDPDTRCWWADMWRYEDLVDVFTNAGYDIKGDTPTPPPPPPKDDPKPNLTLEAAVDKIIYAVSDERKNRLIRAIAAAAHPDGDSPSRPAAADDLILIATTRLGVY